MAAIPAQIPDEFGLGPIEDSVLRFVKKIERALFGKAR